MQTSLTIIGGIAAAVAATVIVTLLAPVFGALAGLIVGGVFSETSRDFLDALGMQKLAMWQFGAMLGFVGGFFRTFVQSKSS